MAWETFTWKSGKLRTPGSVALRGLKSSALSCVASRSFRRVGRQQRRKLKGAIVTYQQPAHLSPAPAIIGSPPPLIQTPATVPDHSIPSPEAEFNHSRRLYSLIWRLLQHGPVEIEATSATRSAKDQLRSTIQSPKSPELCGSQTRRYHLGAFGGIEARVFLLRR